MQAVLSPVVKQAGGPDFASFVPIPALHAVEEVSGSCLLSLEELGAKIGDQVSIAWNGPSLL